MELQTVKLLLGITAAALHGTAYFLYNVQAKLGQSKPKAASWAVWAVFAILNAFTYKEMTGDPYAAFQFFMGSFACMATFLYVWYIGGFGRPTRRDVKFGLVGSFAGLVWIVFHAADWAQLILLVAFVFSFVPTYEGVRDNPHSERPRSWIIWTCACTVTLVNKSIGLDTASITALGLVLGFALPVTLIIAHGLVALLSRRSRKQRFVNFVA